MSEQHAIALQAVCGSCVVELARLGFANDEIEQFMHAIKAKSITVFPEVAEIISQPIEVALEALPALRN